MDFGLSAEQTMLTDSVGRALEGVVPIETLRDCAAGNRTSAAWNALCDLGVPGLMIGEAQGGSGLGAVDAALVAQRLGANAAPSPWLGTCVLAPLALAQAGSPAQQAAWLPRLAGGETVVGVALSEHCGARDGAGVSARDGRLHGHALFVIDFEADAYLVADGTGAVHLVEADAEGLERRALVTVDVTRAIGELVMDGVAAEPLSSGTGPLAPLLVDWGRVMLAADTLGAAQRMLDRAVAYAGEREQFGRVIGSFQAVKHLCAEMAASLEPCHAFVWYAAHALDALPDESHVHACQVKAHLGDVGKQVAKTATEVHGGVGFTDLLGLHYWFKRIGLNRQLLGGPERARHEAAVAQGYVQA